MMHALVQYWSLKQILEVVWPVGNKLLSKVVQPLLCCPRVTNVNTDMLAHMISQSEYFPRVNFYRIREA